jgi:hypothetical protein
LVKANKALPPWRVLVEIDAPRAAEPKSAAEKIYERFMKMHLKDGFSDPQRLLSVSE